MSSRGVLSTLFGLIFCLVFGAGLDTLQVGPLTLQNAEEVNNAKILHEYIQRIFYSHSNMDSKEWLLIWGRLHGDLLELARVAREEMPGLLFAVGTELYHWHWFHYNDGRPKLNDDALTLGADLLARSLNSSVASPCVDPTAATMFLQHACDYRWTHLIMIEAEVARERMRKLDLAGAETMLSAANTHFAQMVQMPFFASRGWQRLLDANFNSEFYPSPGPTWENSLIPFAAFLEANFLTFLADLDRIRNVPGLFELLWQMERNAEGNDHWRLDDWQLIELADTREEEPFKQACQIARATCDLLISRPEVGGCKHAWAGFALLRAGGQIKAHMGMGPRLVVHVGLDVPEEQPIYLYVGNQTLQWTTGKSHVFDDTYIHSVQHTGFGGRDRYILHTLICHPCEPSQRHLYERDGHLFSGIDCAV